MFALLAGSFIAGLRINMRLLGTHDPHTLMRVYLAIEVPALALLVALFALHAPLWAVLLALAVVKACLGGTFPNAAAETMEPFARSAGSVSALLGTLQFGLSGIVAAVLATLAFMPSLEMSMMMLVLAAVAAVLLALRRA